MTDLRPPSPASRRRRPAVTAMLCAGVGLGMVGVSFAAVPLYQIFCQATGFGGTTQRAAKGADHVLDRKVTIRFDANIGNGLGWRFRPVTREITLKIGETGQAFFRARNITGETSTATASFNVTPEQVGVYFTKIACFCFTEQTLKAGEEIDMPVVFYVDPSIAKDPELDFVHTITLSYTFFPVDKPVNKSPVAEVPRAGNRL